MGSICSLTLGLTYIIIYFHKTIARRYAAGRLQSTITCFIFIRSPSSLARATMPSRACEPLRRASATPLLLGAGRATCKRCPEQAQTFTCAALQVRNPGESDRGGRGYRWAKPQERETPGRKILTSTILNGSFKSVERHTFK